MILEHLLEPIQVVAGIREDFFRVVGLHQLAGHPVAFHSSLKQGRSEDHPSWVEDPFQVIQSDGFGVNGAGQAGQQIGQCDGVEPLGRLYESAPAH